MENLNILNRKKRGFIPFVTAAIMVISLFAAMPAMAQPYVITGSAPASFGCTQAGVANTDIESVLNAIRTDANGAECIIQFGSGGSTLNLGSDVMLFSSGLTPAWGTVHLIGRVTSSNADYTIRTIIVSLAASGAEIENTGTGDAIRNEDTGTLNIEGGLVKAASGRAILNSSTGIVYISGGTVTSANTSEGTIYLANTGDTGTQLVITDGTISNSASGGNMIYTVAPTVLFSIASGNSYEFYGAIAGAGNVEKADSGDLVMKNNSNDATGTFLLLGGTTTLEGNWGG